MQTGNDISCKKIQELLLDRNPGKLDEIVTWHLQTCEECREFQGALTAISDSAQISSEEYLQPDPRIMNALKRNLQKQSNPNNLLESLLTLFQKRIPVYQILLGVFIAAIFYFSITKINFFPVEPEQSDVVLETENQVVQSVEFPVLQLEQDQQIGKSLSEDSLSAKFRVSVL